MLESTVFTLLTTPFTQIEFLATHHHQARQILTSILVSPARAAFFSHFQAIHCLLPRKNPLGLQSVRSFFRRE